METVTLHVAGNVTGMTPEQLGEMHADFSAYDIIRRVERWSIREFMRENAGVLKGRVLDFGAGTQPYRALLACSEYVPWSPGQNESVLFESVGFDGVLCNQVLQYVHYPRTTFSHLHELIKPGGHLVLTFPTNWDEVEDNDFWRFTSEGMVFLLKNAGFSVKKIERRAQVQMHNFKFPLGYGVVAVKA